MTPNVCVRIHNQSSDLTVQNVSIKNECKLAKIGTFDSTKNHKRQRRKRQSVTAKREKSQTPKFV